MMKFMLSVVLMAVSAQHDQTPAGLVPQSASDCVTNGTDSAKMSGNWSGFWKDIGIPKKHMITVNFCITNNLIVGDVG